MSLLNNNISLPEELLRFLGSVLDVLGKEKKRANAAAGGSCGSDGTGSTDCSASSGSSGTSSFSGSSGGLNPELSTQQAADLLLMTRPEVEEMLDENKIPYQERSEERRIRLKDLELLRNQRQVEREARLEELERQLKELKECK